MAENSSGGGYACDVVPGGESVGHFGAVVGGRQSVSAGFARNLPCRISSSPSGTEPVLRIRFLSHGRHFPLDVGDQTLCGESQLHGSETYESIRYGPTSKEQKFGRAAKRKQTSESCTCRVEAGGAVSYELRPTSHLLAPCLSVSANWLPKLVVFAGKCTCD